jgi:type-F conjugative transfer system secretin TraK
VRRSLLAAACAITLAAAAFGAAAQTVKAQDGRFEAEVSATQMSRIAVHGEKVVSVRQVEDPEGPKMMIEAEETTGDVYVAFDGDVIGRSFSVFLVTESGKTVQALLRPMAGEGATVLVRLEGGSVQQAAASPPVQVAGQAPAGVPQRSDRRASYPETLTAFIRLMFNGEAPDGVSRRTVADKPRQAGPFKIGVAETYEVSGLRGQVLLVQNTDKQPQTLAADAFVVSGVLAAAASHPTLRPGEAGRVYLVEEVR